MAGQIEGVGWSVLGDIALIECPAEIVPAEAMDENDWRAGLGSSLHVADAPVFDVDDLRRGPAALAFLRCLEVGKEVGDEGLDIGIACRGICDDAEERADRHRLSLADDLS